MNRISHWIDGKVVLGTSGRSGVVFNPATGEQASAVGLERPGPEIEAVHFLLSRKPTRSMEYLSCVSSASRFSSSS